MELLSFRELLLKKADENPYLQALIKYAKDDLIANCVLESLQKMAEPSAAMGRGANSAITSYAGQMTNSDVHQLKDALAHHVSHYKGALKSGNREVADQHLNHVIPLMHLAGRASKHSGGKMVLDYRSTTPWESNYTTTDRHEHNSKLKEGTKDLGRRPKNTRGTTQRGVPNYHYLEMAPHQGHGDTKHLANPQSGYPFEEIQLGSPQDRDAGKAYLHLEDVGPQKEYVPHPFDAHPVHQYADDKFFDSPPVDENAAKDIQAKKEKYIQDLSSWRQSPHHQKWIADHKAKYAADPEGYKKRGTVKPGHFYDGLPLQDQPAHAKVAATTDAPTAQDDSEEGQSAPAQAQAQAQAQASAPVKPAKSNEKLTPEELELIPPALRKKLGLA
jgi:hypothetical protein